MDIQTAGNTVTERFHQKYTPEPNSGCWLWTASGNNKGYGQIRRGQTQAKAHRVSWELHHGPIPDNLCVLHTCDTPPCVNPHHLFLGTVADNNADMVAKGRHSAVSGESHYRAKLTAAQVVEIRSRQGQTHKALAKEFGVSNQQISKIRAGEFWKPVPPKAP